MDQEGGLRVDEDVKLIFDYLKDYKNYINKLLSNTSEIEGMTTGIEELDKITGGFKEGELSVLAARTSIGRERSKKCVKPHFQFNSIFNLPGKKISS